MPIYDYVCSSCGTRTEFIHGIDAEAPRFCPACGADGTLRKAFVAPSVHFKGSGWAKKDRSSSSSGTKARSGTDSSSKSDGSPSDSSGSGSGSGSDSASSSGSASKPESGGSSGASTSSGD